MTPEQFIGHWSPGGGGYGMSERGGAQPHFIDLCNVLGVQSPNDADNYSFEFGAKLLDGKRGFADVFKRGVCAWEYKQPGGDLVGALRRLKDYASALDNPPLLVVSDRMVFRVYTQFTGRPTEIYEVALKALNDPAKRELLRRAFTDPASFQPKRTNRDITEAAAKAFADVAERMPEPAATSVSRSAASRPSAWRTSSRAACSASSRKTLACCPSACLKSSLRFR